MRTGADQGFPASVLTDNGMVFTTRFAGGRGGRNGLETTLAALGITQKNSRPNHPTTCGKVERFQQTLKQWLRQQPRARTIGELQHQLDTLKRIYNHDRPHTSLRRRTPAVVYGLLPKTGPAGTTPTHHRIRHDRIDKTGSVTIRHNGRLHHIGIGRAHAGTDIVISSTTSTSASSTPPPANSSATSPSTPPATTNPPAAHPGHPETTRAEPANAGSALADVSRHHMVAGAPGNGRPSAAPAVKSLVSSVHTPGAHLGAHPTRRSSATFIPCTPSTPGHHPPPLL